jgi:hypothetical protein
MSKIREAYHALTSPLARRMPRWDFEAVYAARTKALYGTEDENAPSAVQISARNHNRQSVPSVTRPHCSMKEEGQ